MLKQNKSLKGSQDKAGNILAAMPLSPNQWTLLSVVFAIAGAIVIAYAGNIPAGLAFFVLSAASDAIDGAVARARKHVTVLGGFIDGVADRFVEAIFLFSFMFYPLPSIIIDPRIWLASAIFLGACMPSFIRAYADHKGVIGREKAMALGGICERSERLLLLVAGLVAGIFFGMGYFVYALILVSALSLITIFQRLYWIAAEAGRTVK